MVVDRAADSNTVGPFRRLLDYMRPGDAIVVNNTKVFKARLFGRRATGAKVEIFLVRRSDPNSERTWLALVHPSRRVKVGEEILFDNWRVCLEADVGGGQWLVRFRSEAQCWQIISRFGHIPLPHYIKRDDQPSDIRRYQTVFANKDNVGAVAAPTAGFHFTRPILSQLEELGVAKIEVCLHVGPGTFKPVKVDNIYDHVVDGEIAELTPAAADQINRVRQNGGRIFAVGTTSVRTLESAEMSDGLVQPFSRMVDLYIKPGHRFQLVDAMLTNFHLPKSSLMILVSAFAGHERIMAAYADAISQRLRFYSYGDAMLII